KADIPQEEFEAFIAVLSAFVAAPGNTNANVAAEIGKTLAARRVSRVSLVFMDELVGRDRHLPWRVEIALTRLRKDLRMIPLLKTRDATELRRIKAQVIDDIIRPLRRADLFKAILLNCDLIRKDPNEVKPAAIELEIIDHLPPAIVGHTALELAKELGSPGPTGANPQRERARHLLRAVVSRLHDQAIPGADQVLTHLFDHRLLTLAELPQHLQEALAIKQFADEYLAHEPQHVERLCALRHDPGAAAAYARIVPELLRRDKYTAALTILRGIESTATSNSASAPGFAALVESIRAVVSAGDLFHTLVERFRTGSTGVRQKVVEALAALGKPGIPPLIEALVDSEDAELRRHLVDALTQIGSPVLWATRLVLDRPGISPRAARDLLAVLAHIGGAEASHTVRRHLHHPDAGVREDAVIALAQISGREAEGDLLIALKDHEPVVRRRALLCLGNLGCSDPRVLEFLCGVVRRRHKDEAEEDDRSQIQDCQALAEIGRVVLSARSTIQPVLIQALDPEGGKGLLGRWSQTSTKSDAVRAAICATLGQIGDTTAAEALIKLTKDKSPLLRERAARALRQFQDRLSRRS
ncbi:MAG TPA: HEAT repeat domain-containing protein, partial [Candidatus Methylomirabilis sp.]|nr:HEAT repeat domain-containing protein [Candidatus Methylomirabilis sp.]